MNQLQGNSPNRSAKSLVSFCFASLFALPFISASALVGIGWCFHQPKLLNFLAVPVLFGSPLILALAVVGLLSIIVSWMRSPNWCRYVLVIYLLIIVGFIILLFESVQGI
jgi:hypothetical protein